MLFSCFYLCLLQGINVAQHDFSLKKLWQVELRGRPVSVSGAFEELGTGHPIPCQTVEHGGTMGILLNLATGTGTFWRDYAAGTFEQTSALASEGCILQRTVERSFPVHVMLHGFKPTIHCNKAKSSRSGHELSITMAGMDRLVAWVFAPEWLWKNTAIEPWFAEVVSYYDSRCAAQVFDELGSRCTWVGFSEWQHFASRQKVETRPPVETKVRR